MKKMVLFLSLLISVAGYSDPVEEVEISTISSKAPAPAPAPAPVAKPCEEKSGFFSKKQECGAKEHNHILVEAKAGYFFPINDTFKEIYQGGGIYGIEVSAQAWKGLYPFISGSYFSEPGRSIGGHTRTVITMAPIDVGLKYAFDLNRYLDVYIGLGAVFEYLNMKDESPYVIQNITKWGYGGIAKAGLWIYATKNFFIDLFGDYRFVTVDFDNTCGGRVVRHDANISGFTAGGGLGYRF